MLQAWASIGYIVLFAIFVLAFVLWRRGFPVLGLAALAVGVPLWCGWEYARPTWTTGLITGTEVRRSDPDAHGNTTDIEYIYMRNRSDRGLELINEEFLVVVEAQQRAGLQRRQDRAVSQHGNDPDVESVAVYPVQLVSERDRHRALRLLAVVVATYHHFLWALRRPLARLFLRLHQVAPVGCAAGSQSQSRVTAAVNSWRRRRGHLTRKFIDKGLASGSAFHAWGLTVPQGRWC